MGTRKLFCFSLTYSLVMVCMHAAITKAQQESAESKVSPANVVVLVTDEAGKAIEGSSVTIFEWTGKFERRPQLQPTFKDGSFHFEKIDTDKVHYLY